MYKALERMSHRLEHVADDLLLWAVQGKPGSYQRVGVFDVHAPESEDFDSLNNAVGKPDDVVTLIL
jgi:hypothetical protein